MLEKDFFLRKAEIVAKELLGKILVRKINDEELRAKIVETEAYYDEKDPASRACKNGDLRETMKMRGGTILVYGCHNNWLINFVTGKQGKAEAVLLRALQPLNFSGNTKGPGLLTRELKINKSFHKESIIYNKKLWIEIGREEKFDKGFEENFWGGGVEGEIIAGKRIGVKKDLKRKLRFYISGNKFVSRK